MKTKLKKFGAWLMAAALAFAGAGAVQAETVNQDQLVAAINAIPANGEGTINLAEGEFTLYGVAGASVSGKTIHFVGSDRANTTWIIGGPDEDKHGEPNADGSFSYANRVSFEKLTIKTKNKFGYQGFTHVTGGISVTDCTIDGVLCYWGETESLFQSCTFQGSGSDYSLWVYGCDKMTFDTCIFNVEGKTIHPYIEGTHTTPYEVNVKDCTVNSTKANKAMVNIKDANAVYHVNFTGNNQVNGLAADAKTGSALFQVEASQCVVTINGKTVWEAGQPVAAPEVEVVVPAVDEQKGITQDIVEQIAANPEVAKVEETGLKAALADVEELKEKEAVVKVELTEVAPTTGVLTYEIKPVVKGEGETPDEDISDKVVGKPITFRVPLTDAFSAFAKVTHKGTVDEISHVEVLGAAGSRYVELTFNHFSAVEFDPELAFPGLPEGAVKVVDGFYQDAATYAASTDFYIVSKAGLEYLRDFVNRVRTDYSDGPSFDYSNKAFGGKTVHLLTDIDLSNESWVSIGWDADKPFCGSFNGENHTISNMKIVNETITKSKGFYAGLFGYLAWDNTTFQNLTFNNVTVKNVSNYAGALCGRYTKVTGAIENIKVTGTVDISATSFVGGIAGHNAAQVSDCSVNAAGQVNATAGGWCGGIAGYVAENSATEIENCSVKGGVSLTGTNIAVGGITGHVGGKNVIRGCTVEVSITGGAAGSTGAIAGKMEGTPAAEIVNNDSTKVVDGEGAAIEKQLGGAYSGAATCIVGTGVTYDENGKINGGSFESLPESAIAEGFVPVVDPETGKTVVEVDPITGSGTEADPYVISDLKGLQAFRDRVNAGNTYQGKFVKLAADIDLASVENWEPIGDFLGTFDGLGNTIDNLTGEHGLFTGLSAHPDKPGATSALIKNFTLDHVRMVSAGNDVGAVAGTSAPGVTIENVHVKNGYVSGRQYVGGIVGHWYATITDCSYEGEVYGMQAGGIAGSGGFVISNCKFVGMVEGDTWVGGICGQFQDGSQMVKDCYVEGTVSADYDFYGAGAAGIVSVPCNLNAEISGNYCNMVAEIGGEAVECPIIGAYNADAEGATFPNLKNNSWNMEKYTITEISVTETGVDEVRAVKPRNANLVGSVKDLEYVGGGVVEIAAGSAIADKTPEEIAAQITNPDLTVKIEDGKIVAYPHVAKVGDTSYLTLDEALQHATDGTTLTLLEDVADIGAATLNGITFDGNGHKIIGASALYCGAEKTTAIKNVVFENIHNAEGSQSAIYGEGFSTGSISITGCTFDTCDWDAIQIVPADGATGKIVIVDNVFKHTDETKSQLRYIHIQHMTTTDVHPVQLDTTITDNRFFDTGKSAGAEKICSILFASVGGTLKVDGNYYDDASTIYTDSIPLRNFYPMRSQPDVDVDDVLFPLFSIDAETYTTLADAVAAANGKSGYPTIRLNGDLVVDETVEINNVNGSLVTFNAAGFDIQANVAMFNIKTKAAFYGDNGYPAQPGLVTCPSEDKVFNVDNGVSLVIQNAVFSKDVSYLVANPHKDVCVLTDDGNYKIVSLTDEQALAKGYVVRNKTSEQDAEYYASIAELISEKYASKGGGTIGLIADVSEDIAVSGKYLAMYAGDYTYTGSVMLDDNKYFGAYSGTVHLTNVNCGPLYAYGGTLVVDNGKAASFGCGSPSDISIRNGIYGSDPTAYVDPEISDVVERATDPVTWEVIEKTSIAAVVSADGTQTEYKKLSKALEAAQPGEKVILLANTDEANVPLKPDQEIVLNGHAFTGTVDQTNVPEGYDAMVTTPDGRVFSAPAKVEVPIGESSVIKVRMLDTAENLATPQANGRPLWANKALGIESDFKIKPVVERPAAGSKTITIKSNIHDSVLEAAAQQRDGVSVKFQLAKKVGSVGTYVQFGEKQPKPEFTVEADEQEVQTFWKIQVFFEEEY